MDSSKINEITYIKSSNNCDIDLISINNKKINEDTINFIDNICYIGKNVKPTYTYFKVEHKRYKSFSIESTNKK
jgi:hypothetical protein